MTYGDRKSARVSFEGGVKTHIVGIDGSWRLACIMSDISQTGARLTITHPIDKLDQKEFFLAISATGGVHRRCELIRLNGNEIGVRFLKAPDAAKKAGRPASGR